MTRKEKEIARLIGTRIKQQDPEAEVILYGSHARGQASGESDWDVLILINMPKKDRKIEKKYRDRLFDLALEIGEPISTLIYSKQDWKNRYSKTPFYQTVVNEGIKLI